MRALTTQVECQKAKMVASLKLIIWIEIWINIGAKTTKTTKKQVKSVIAMQLSTVSLLGAKILNDDLDSYWQNKPSLIFIKLALK